MNRLMLVVAVCCLVGGVASAQNGVPTTPLTQVAAAAPSKALPNSKNTDVPGRARPLAQELPLSPAQQAEERGDLDMARKNFREAVDAYQEAVHLRPNNAIAWNKMGIAHHQLMELSLAKNCYQKAVKLNPKYAEAINNLGTVYYRSELGPGHPLL